MMNNPIMIDVPNKQIRITRRFSLKAGTVGTAEFQKLVAARKIYPEFPVVVRTIEKKADKRTYHGWTYDKMRDFIKALKGNDSIEVAEFDGFCETAKSMPGEPYPHVKHWFLEKYSKEIKGYEDVKG